MALIRPHVKWAARPSRLREVVPALEEAFRVAREGVPGPVFVELAVDLLFVFGGHGGQQCAHSIRNIRVLQVAAGRVRAVRGIEAARIGDGGVHE